MEFFKDLETTDVTKMSGLKAGKAAEQAEFDNLLREVEKELDQAASQAPRRRSEDEVKLTSFPPLQRHVFLLSSQNSCQLSEFCLPSCFVDLITSQYQITALTN